jgi:hypothetical protein
MMRFEATEEEISIFGDLRKYSFPFRGVLSSKYSKLATEKMAEQINKFMENNKAEKNFVKKEEVDVMDRTDLVSLVSNLSEMKMTKKTFQVYFWNRHEFFVEAIMKLLKVPQESSDVKVGEYFNYDGYYSDKTPDMIFSEMDINYIVEVAVTKGDVYLVRSRKEEIYEEMVKEIEDMGHKVLLQVVVISVNDPDLSLVPDKLDNIREELMDINAALVESERDILSNKEMKVLYYKAMRDEEEEKNVERDSETFSEMIKILAADFNMDMKASSLEKMYEANNKILASKKIKMEKTSEDKMVLRAKEEFYELDTDKYMAELLMTMDSMFISEKTPTEL